MLSFLNEEDEAQIVEKKITKGPPAIQKYTSLFWKGRKFNTVFLIFKYKSRQWCFSGKYLHLLGICEEFNAKGNENKVHLRCPMKNMFT